MHLPSRGLKTGFKMVLLCCQGNVKGGEEKVHFFLYYLLALPSSLPHQKMPLISGIEPDCMQSVGSRVDRGTHRRPSESSRSRWPSFSTFTL